MLHSEISHGNGKSLHNCWCMRVLHNIAIFLKEPMDVEMNDVNDVHYGADQGRAVRNHICRTYFS